MSESTSTTRLLFLDNVRYLMVGLVLLLHVSGGYSGRPEFYIEANSGGFIATLRSILDPIPRMPTLFFVSGYFALSSLSRHGYGGMLWRKFYRLGIPWLLCIFFVGPLMPYMGYYSQSFNGLDSSSYWSFWTGYIQSGFSDWIVPSVLFHQPAVQSTALLVHFGTPATLRHPGCCSRALEEVAIAIR